MRQAILLFLLAGSLAIAQKTEININQNVKGSLMVPVDADGSVPLVIMISGSGPNDRDGDSKMTRHQSLLQLAQKLDSAGIATYRYDKRSFTMVKEGRFDNDISFDDFVADASAAVNYFSDDPRFNQIIILGHSQGSLVGLLAIDERVDKFISVAGAGDTIDKVISSQINKQMPGLGDEAQKTFQQMREQDEPVTEFNPYLNSIFNVDMQPFMESWMAYDPAAEIGKVEIPVLILNGNRDVQVDEEQAQILKAAQPDATYEVITGMNHVLKSVPEDTMLANKSYSDPNFKIHPKLVSLITTFVKKG